MEEARESIFTRPGGAAVARRGRGRWKKSAGAFVLIRYGLEEASEKYSSRTQLGEYFSKKSVVDEMDGCNREVSSV